MGCRVLLQGIFPTQGSTCVSYVSCLGRGLFTTSATWEALQGLGKGLTEAPSPTCLSLRSSVPSSARGLPHLLQAVVHRCRQAWGKGSRRCWRWAQDHGAGVWGPGLPARVPEEGCGCAWMPALWARAKSEEGRVVLPKGRLGLARDTGSRGLLLAGEPYVEPWRA